MWLCLMGIQKDTTKNIAQVNIPGRLGPGDVWEPMPWPGWRVADDPGMMESLLHTDSVSVKDKTM